MTLIDPKPPENRKALARIGRRTPPTIELQAIRMARRDYEFLPAALEILEAPPSPIRIWLMLAICALIAVALVWSYFGRLDVIAVAQGKLQPIGRTKIVQPLETGKVQALEVGNGTAVKAGQVLVQLDPSEALADEGTLETTLVSLRAEIARRKAAMAAIADRDHIVVPQIKFDSDIPAPVAELQQQVLDEDIGQLVGTVDSLKAQVTEKMAERDGFQAAVTAQQQLIATEQDRVNMRQTLMQQAAESKADLIDAQETMQTQQTNLQSLKEQYAAAAADIGVTQRAIDKTFTDFIADNGEKLADASRNADDSASQLAKAKVVASQMTITSPIDGIVQGLSVTNVGQVVTTGQEILQIVPAATQLNIEAYLPNDDVGFIRKGDDAVVKVEAFPFTRYGTLNARVLSVAKDAIPLADATQQEEDPASSSDSVLFGGAERTQNLFFPVTLALDKNTIDIDGAQMPLVSGMAVTVEIKTGDRSILEYVASPLLQVFSQAMKER